jgi:hypothetical protein
MLVYQPESRTYWFNACSLEGEEQFMLLGLVLGLAIYNRCVRRAHRWRPGPRPRRGCLAAAEVPSGARGRGQGQGPASKAHT